MLDDRELDLLLSRRQDGVVSRRQLKQLGARDHDIARLVRRRDLVVVHPGVLVDHTGPLMWVQRAWVAVLACWPAALSHHSALPRPSPDGPIHVSLDHRRTVRAPDGVVVHRMADLQTRVRWTLSPPRVRLEDAAIDVALTHDDVAARFRVFADACQTRETHPAAIARALARRRRVRDRAQLRDLLGDLATGACSVLERGYLDLERRHGLPGADRQAHELLAGRGVYRDVPYPPFSVVVELDGRAFHDTAAARDRDAERDLDSRVADELTTVRLTYGQVFGHGCRTIRKIATLLERRGWSGPFRHCPSCR